MGSNSEKLQQLRPVTFQLKTDPGGTVQYGLIAEEVAKVYPELVIRDQNGRIDGVRYEELAPMLLNEVQKITAQIEKNAVQAAEIRELKQQMADMHAALLKLEAKDERIAQR
jgi:cytochrome c-type biogenesis protein CcmE